MCVCACVRALQQKHKQEQLLMRLQSLMQSTNMESQVAVSEVLDYFLKRLSSLQSSTRKQAVKVYKLSYQVGLNITG